MAHSISTTFFSVANCKPCQKKRKNVNNLILIGLHCTERPFLKLLMHNVFTKKNSDGSRH